jgi:hypothetical protein
VWGANIDFVFVLFVWEGVLVERGMRRVGACFVGSEEPASAQQLFNEEIVVYISIISIYKLIIKYILVTKVVLGARTRKVSVCEKRDSTVEVSIILGRMVLAPEAGSKLLPPNPKTQPVRTYPVTSS